MRLIARCSTSLDPSPKTGPGGNLGGRLRIFVLEAGAATQLGYRPYLRNAQAQRDAAKDFFALSSVDRGVNPMVDKVSYYTYLSDPSSEPFVPDCSTATPMTPATPTAPPGQHLPRLPASPGPRLITATRVFADRRRTR